MLHIAACLGARVRVNDLLRSTVIATCWRNSHKSLVMMQQVKKRCNKVTVQAMVSRTNIASRLLISCNAYPSNMCCLTYKPISCRLNFCCCYTMVLLQYLQGATGTDRVNRSERRNNAAFACEDGCVNRDTADPALSPLRKHNALGLCRDWWGKCLQAAHSLP